MDIIIALIVESIEKPRHKCAPQGKNIGTFCNTKERHCILYLLHFHQLLYTELIVFLQVCMVDLSSSVAESIKQTDLEEGWSSNPSRLSRNYLYWATALHNSPKGQHESAK